MVIPPVIAVLIVLVGLGRLSFANRQTTETFQLLTVPFLLQLFFLAYPLVTNVVRAPAYITTMNARSSPDTSATPLCPYGAKANL